MTSARRILIVEDEPLITMMLEDFLEILGYEVAGSAECTTTAFEAIATGDFDAAILDVNLRGGEKCWPVADMLSGSAIPFVLATGGSIDAVPEHYRDRPTLTKPYTLDGIRQVLASLS